MSEESRKAAEEILSTNPGLSLTQSERVQRVMEIIDRYFTPMFMPCDDPLPTCEEMAEYGWSTDVFAAEINRASAAINAAWFKKVKDDGHALGLIPSPLYWINKYLLPVLQKATPLLTEVQKFNDKLVSENRMLKFEAEQRKLKNE